MAEKHPFQQWAEAYQKSAADGTDLMWPSETLVRLFKGAYIPGMDKSLAGKKVLDVSVGNGNNLAFLATQNLQLFGTEVDEGLCATVRAKLRQLGKEADIRVGTNRSLPFPDNEFDFLVSWNVLHYEDTEDKIRAGIAEYARVLKPGGRFFLSTTGPEHLILKGSTTLGGHRYLIGCDNDFRKGQVYFYFDNPAYIRHYFGANFKDVLVGRTHDFLMTGILDWYVVTGVK